MTLGQQSQGAIPNMYNRSTSFKVLYVLKATSYINDSIIDYQSSTHKDIMVSYIDMIGLCHSVTIL